MTDDDQEGGGGNNESVVQRAPADARGKPQLAAGPRSLITNETISISMTIQTNKRAGVCDDPDYFYDVIDGLYEGLGWPTASAADPSKPADARATLEAVQSRGLGYAMSSEEELRTVQEVAGATGLVLDPVYGGKALHALLSEMRADPGAWEGRRVLFLHTGGLLVRDGRIESEEQEWLVVAVVGRGAVFCLGRPFWAWATTPTSSPKPRQNNDRTPIINRTNETIQCT